jgi:hypothetical protein
MSQKNERITAILEAHNATIQEMNKTYKFTVDAINQNNNISL